MASFTAHVVPGKKRGRKIGYPTVNLDVGAVPDDVTYGIYACWVSSFELSAVSCQLPAVAHYGPHPAFEDTRVTFEVHVLEGKRGQLESLGKRGELTIEIVQKIRNVKDFPDVAPLQKQIAKDCEDAHKILLSLQ